MSTAQLKFTTVAVTSFYGWRVLKATGKENQHKGVDTANGLEYPHSVFGDGVVKFAGRHPWRSKPPQHPDYERGIHVIVEHAPGIETSYHSLSKLNVKTGDRVRMGNVIGWAGKSATAASGNHVHNALWLNGVHVDPLKYLTPGKVVTVSNAGAASGGNATPLNNKTTPTRPPIDKKDMTMRYFYGGKERGGMLTTENAGVFYPASSEEGVAWSLAYNGLDVDAATFDYLRATALKRRLAFLADIANAVPAAKLTQTANGIDQEKLTALIAAIPDAVRTNIKGAL